jgi:hypothetical protein
VQDEGATDFDPEAVHAKYLAERDKRLVAGRSDIRDLDHDEHFARFREDPFTPRIERAPLREDVDVVIVGGGIAGVLPGPSCARPGCGASASSTRRGASAAPGTGTATPA